MCPFRFFELYDCKIVRQGNGDNRNETSGWMTGQYLEYTIHGDSSSMVTYILLQRQLQIEKDAFSMCIEITTSSALSMQHGWVLHYILSCQLTMVYCLVEQSTDKNKSTNNIGTIHFVRKSVDDHLDVVQYRTRGCSERCHYCRVHRNWKIMRNVVQRPICPISPCHNSITILRRFPYKRKGGLQV